MSDASTLDFHQRMASLEFLHSRHNKFPSAHRAEYGAKLDKIRAVWAGFHSLIPSFFFRRADKHLNTLYKYEDIEKELLALVT